MELKIDEKIRAPRSFISMVVYKYLKLAVLNRNYKKKIVIDCFSLSSFTHHLLKSKVVEQCDEVLHSALVLLI